MKVMLGVPFFGDDPHRKALFSYTWAHLMNLYAWDEVAYSGHSNTRGGARNDLVHRAEELGIDVVVICDADSFPEKEALVSSIESAHLNSVLNFSYSRYQVLNQRGTNKFILGHHDYAEHLHASGPGSLGGCFAIRPEDWWWAGGSPEFPGWGFEDVMFAVQARTLLGDSVWHPGVLTCLFHPTECSVGSEEYNRNISYCKEVEALDRQPGALRAHIRSSPLWRE